MTTHSRRDAPVAPDGQASPSATALALEISHCVDLPLAAETMRHPCHRIVALQSDSPPHERHLPEAWAGNLELGRIVFVSSNPSISTLGPEEDPRIRELFPTPDWPAARVVEFVTRRFGTGETAFASPDGRHLQIDGCRNATATPFWRQVRKRARELLGPEASPESDYCMTEVVHCKSGGEGGVERAASHCASRYLDRILTLSPAPLVVVTGSKARDILRPMWRLSPEFGSRSSMRSFPAQSLKELELGGRARLVVYIPHVTGMEPRQTFKNIYLDRGIDVAALAGLTH